MKNIYLTSILGATLSLSAIAGDSYTIDPRHTFPSFEINHLGFSIQRGRFDRTSGKVFLAPESGTGNITITIEAASINTGLTELENHLRGADFFDTARFPTITFKSDKLHFKKDQLLAADGLLTMHGVAKPVHLTVDQFHCGMNLISMKNTCGANVSAALKRSDFGIDKYVPLLADDVKIEIQIEAIRD